MSEFKGHLLFGGIVAVAFIAVELFALKNYDWITLSLGVILSLFMSIAPDVDSAASKARKIFLGTSFAAIILLAILQMFWMIVIVCIIAMIVVLDSKHRGITHSMWFGIIVCLPFAFYDVWVALAGFLAVTSHLLLDSMGKQDDFPY
jgi:membrane-bound metal-dependent hydrolase YbcI (DUF457 family)